MKKYLVWIPFQGSLAVEVWARDAEEALIVGESKIDKMNNDDIAENAEFDNFEVEEIR